MPEEKKYSLISVDVAPEEEVLHVDASGVHEQSAPRGEGAASAGSAQVAGDSAAAGDGSHGAAASASEQQADGKAVGHAPASEGKAAGHAVSSRPGSQDTYRATDKDLEGPVPMAGLQKAIIAVVVVCLVGFAVYFGLTH